MMIPAYMSAFTSSHPLAIRKSTSFSRKLHVWYFVLLMIYEINHIWTVEMNWKWRKWSSQWTQFMQLRKEAWKKIQDFNGVWTHDLAITGLKAREIIRIWTKRVWNYSLTSLVTIWLHILIYYFEPKRHFIHHEKWYSIKKHLVENSHSPSLIVQL